MSTASLNFTLTTAAINAAFSLGSINLNVTHVQLGTGNRVPNGGETILVNPQEYAAISSYIVIAPDQHRIVADIVASALNYNVSEIGIWSGIPNANIVCSGVAGNTFLTASSPVTIASGTAISGPGIPSGATVSSTVTASTNIPISSALAATQTNQSYLVGNSVLVFYWSQASGFIAVKSASVDFIFEDDLFFGGVVPSNITIVVDTSGAAGMIGVHNIDPLAHPQFATKVGVQGVIYSSNVAGGTANAITATFTPNIDLLVNGMTLFVRAASANTTTTPTFTPFSGTIAAKTIVKGNGLALAVGDIAGAGHWLSLTYDATLDKWVISNPAKGISLNGLGVGQVWGSYTGSRVSGTTYTNTTGAPIYVFVVASTGGVSPVVVGGVTVTTGGSLASWGGIIPVGASYNITATSFSQWSELR